MKYNLISYYTQHRQIAIAESLGCRYIFLMKNVLSCRKYSIRIIGNLRLAETVSIMLNLINKNYSQIEQFLKKTQQLEFGMMQIKEMTKQDVVSL